MTKSNGDYEIGRGKPPARSQFKPGQSGNPGGKKKGSTNLKIELERALQRPINYKENGEPKTTVMLAALFRQLVTQAVKGNLKAIAMVLSLAERLLDVDPEAAVETPEEDLEILQRAFRDPQFRSPMTGGKGQRQNPDLGDLEESGDD